MKYIRRYNESTIIKATNETLNEILIVEIRKLGKEADLNHIDVSNVTNMYAAFSGSYFMGDISNWNVSNVENIMCIFQDSKFNGDISNWNVEKVIEIQRAFNESQFNGDLNNWRLIRLPKKWTLTDYTIFMYSPLQGREPWWYSMAEVFDNNFYLMWDSIDLGWIDFDKKTINKKQLSKILNRAYNKNWNGELPYVWNFTYN